MQWPEYVNSNYFLVVVAVDTLRFDVEKVRKRKSEATIDLDLWKSHHI